MKFWPSKAVLLGTAASLILTSAALSQDSQDTELPPGFGDPAVQPAAPVVPEQPTVEEVPNILDPAAPGPRRPRSVDESLPQEESALVEEEQLPRLPPNLFLVPDDARRPTVAIGPLGSAPWSLGDRAFGNANGAFLATLIRRVEAPLPSRWASILLRRALLTRAQAPAYVHPVDWVAERAALLLRMGEADAARMLVQSVDTPDYTPRMMRVALDTALATSDVGALCPLVAPARELVDQPIWPLAEAMCGALEGEAARASQLIDQARRRGQARGIDLTLAEKVVGAGTDTRRSVTIQWEEVQGLDPWRLGLAAATGMEIPDRLIDGAPSHLRAWYARAPMVPIESRLDAAAVAAALGVFSSENLAEAYSLVLERGDPAEGPGAEASRLRNAWVHRDIGERFEAVRELWGAENLTDPERYGRLILTSGAAARLPVTADQAGISDRLVASMLSAGLDRPAARWAAIASESNPAAWALLAVGAPQGTVEVTAARVEDYAEQGRDERRRAALLLAGLAGLERLPAAEASEVASSIGAPIGVEDRWTRMLDMAVQRRQTGTVAVLAATGLQTASWDGVPPAYLYRIVRALRAVGLDYEARMIAAEAVARS